MLLDSVYVHVPFCTRRCDYCDFARVAGAPPALRARWLARLNDEAAAKHGLAGPLRSLYLGGGTPSSLTVGEWRVLLGTLERWFTRAADCEFSVEANPDSVTPAKAELLVARGVNRVSLGLQSFSPATRRALGRRGSAAAIPRAVAAWRRAGLTNLGCDLIYGAPGQTLAAWREDLERVLELQPQHVSCYELTLAPDTPLARRGARELPEDELIAMWQTAGEVLGRAGLARYEISNYALQGCECRHNRDIWYGGRFLGLGPAACWFIGGSRWTNPSDLESWLAGVPPAEDALPAAERAAEILVIGLRTIAGWTANRFWAATGYDYRELRGPIIDRLVAEGLLTCAADRLAATDQGLLLANYVARELL